MHSGTRPEPRPGASRAVRGKRHDFRVALECIPAIAVVFTLSVCFCAPLAQGQIAGSAHDFSALGWSGGDVCIVCHTPHASDTTVVAPLWNHELTVATFVLYSSPTLDVPVGQPGSDSRLCLSCHDGTVAVDSYGGNTGGNFLTGSASVGTNLEDDHPIGMPWDHQTTTPSCSNCHDLRDPGVFVDGALPFFGPAGSRTMECGTCHDPHNESGFAALLRKSPAGSDLCLTCHRK